MRLRLLLLPCLLLLAACQPGDRPDQGAELAALQAEIAELKSDLAAASAPPELGQQMLELQIRHARLWQAGESRNWMLAQFQLAELRETLNGVVELNGEHPSLQPQQLSTVLPAIMNPALSQMQAAVDARDGAAFDASYDAVSKACTDCHASADHGFLVIERPRTPVLDNLRAAP